MMRKYGYDALEKFCNDNNIELKYDYSDEKINLYYKIEGTCKSENCTNEFNVGFQSLIRSGGLCRVCLLKKRTKHSRDDLEKYCNDNNIELSEDYSDAILKDCTIIKGKCITKDCDGEFSKELQYLLRLGAYCRVCAKNNAKEKTANTNIKKFGHKFVFHNKEIKAKMDKTNIEKYGSTSPMQNKNIKAKRDETNIERYGSKSVFQNEKIKEKKYNTNMKKYGVKHVMQNEDIKAAAINTSIKRYGTKFPNQNNEVRKKIENTVMQRYGVTHIMHNAEIAEKAGKAGKNAFKPKEYTLPSGEVIKVQGYEPFALDKLINDEEVNEEDLITDRTKVPEIWYNYDGDRHRYYTDIFIESQNRCIEVKSTYTFNIEKERIFCKHEAVKNAGFKSEIWVFDKKGNIVESYD